MIDANTETELRERPIELADDLIFRRSKIDRGFDRPLLHTVRGAGYMLSGEAS